MKASAPSMVQTFTTATRFRGSVATESGERAGGYLSGQSRIKTVRGWEKGRR